MVNLDNVYYATIKKGDIAQYTILTIICKVILKCFHKINKKLPQNCV